jgi:hypothetical protein
MRRRRRCCEHTFSQGAYVSIRQHTLACVSIRQHMRAHLLSRCIRQHTLACVSIRQHMRAHLLSRCIRQHTSAYVSIRQHTSAYASTPTLKAPRCYLLTRTRITFLFQETALACVCSRLLAFLYKKYACLQADDRAAAVPARCCTCVRSRRCLPTATLRSPLLTTAARRG